MAEVRWIKVTLFVTLLLLQFTAVTGETSSSVITRAGDEVTLSCNKEIKHQDKCIGTVWLYTRSGGTVELVNLGVIKDKSNRLGLTADCSLVIRNVTTKDVGRYTCREFNKVGGLQGPGAVVVLHVINMEDQSYDDTVVLACSVLTDGGCDYTVEWLYEGNENDVETSQYSCAATVTFKPPHLSQKSKYYELLKCKVKDSKSGNTLLYEVCTWFSCEKTGSTSVERNNDPPTAPGWWRFIILGLATLVITVVAVYVWKRTKGNKTQTDINAVHHEEEDEDEGTVTYENGGEPSASVRLH